MFLQLLFVFVQSGFHMAEEGGTVTRVAYSNRTLTDVSSQVQVVLFPFLERFMRQ
jgi:hypothetical protein